MSNNTISSEVNNSICEAVGCFANAKFKVPINVGTIGKISLFLCESCKSRFSTDDANYIKISEAAN
jgi:uncharacterized protein YlaI